MELKDAQTIDLFAPRGNGGYLPSIADRIEVDDCWEWKGCRDPNGYGRLTTEGSSLAHRVVWEALVGPIPEGLGLDHLCQNPPCVNPDHLEPVTQAVNLQRALTGTIRRERATCSKGHLYDSSESYATQSRRWCRVCRREAQRLRRAT